MATDRHWRSRGLDLHYREWGDAAAPAIVLVHGGLENAHAWDGVAARLASGWRVIAPDLRGHGDSAWAAGGAYGILDFASDIAALFAQAGIERAALVGHSLGGAVVTQFAALYPERITRLCNIEGLRPASEDAPRSVEEKFAAIRAWSDKYVATSAASPRERGAYPSIEAMVARLLEFDPMMSPALARELVTTNVRPAEGGWRWKYDPAIRETALISIIGPEPAEYWRRIACPTLLVYGAKSWATNPASDGRLAHFRDARVVEVTDAGHNVHHHQPEAFLRLLEDFLREA